MNAKKIIAMLLTLLMAMALMSVAAFAGNDEAAEASYCSKETQDNDGWQEGTFNEAIEHDYKFDLFGDDEAVSIQVNRDITLNKNLSLKSNGNKEITYSISSGVMNWEENEGGGSTGTSTPVYITPGNYTITIPVGVGVYLKNVHVSSGNDIDLFSAPEGYQVKKATYSDYYWVAKKAETAVWENIWDAKGDPASSTLLNSKPGAIGTGDTLDEANINAGNVAKVETEEGPQYFSTLKAANEYATDGETIVLITDYELPETLVISSNINLNLNGKTLTCTASEAVKKRIEIASGAEVTICGVVSGWSYGKIKNSVTLSNVEPGKAPGASMIKNEGTLTLSKVYVESDDICIWAKNGTLNVDYTVNITSKFGNAIATNGTANNAAYDSNKAVVNITGGTIKSTNDVAVYIPAGTFNITGGNITGATGVYMKGGKLNISGSRITGNGQEVEYTYYNNGGIPTGDALVVDVCGYPYGADPAISVTDGVFKSTNADAVGSYAHTGFTAKTKFLSGGEYNTEPNATYVADNFAAYETEDGYEILASGKPLAWTVDGNNYRTLEAAIANAKANDTITLNQNISGDEAYGLVSYKAAEGIIIDLNGHSITNDTSYGIAFHNNSNITITGNGTITNSKDYYSAAPLSDSGAKVTVNGGTYTHSSDNGLAVWVASSGDWTINGGTFNGVMHVEGKPSWSDRGGKLTITGGTFNGGLDFGEGSIISITGGTFTEDPSKYVAEGYAVYQKGDKFVVGPADAAEAKIGNVEYLTLQDAFDTAQNGDTVKLLKNVALTGTSVADRLIVNTSVTLDMDGKTISFDNSIADGGYNFAVLWVLNDATLTLTGNGTIDGISAQAYGINVGYTEKKDGDTITRPESAGNLVIENGTVKGDTSALQIQVGTITINDGNFEAKPYEGSYRYTLNCIDASYQAEKAIYTVKGGRFYKYDPANSDSENPRGNFIAEGYESVADGNYYNVIPHVHSIQTYENPTWNWRYSKGTWNVTSTYTGKCRCGETVSESFDVEKVSRTETIGGYEYTATDVHGNSDTKTYYYNYKVKYSDDQSQAPGTYLYGDTCKLISDIKSDWTIVGESKPRAVGTTTFYFPVTSDMEVTRVDSQEQGDVQVASSAVVEAESHTNKTLTYKFVWSIPEGSQVESAMIYRCKDNDAAITTSEALLAATNLRSYNTRMFYRNGEYTYTATGLTSGTAQTIMFRIVYTLNGEKHTLDTKPLNNISIK